MKNIVKITGLIALFYVQSALAITPENGWWWNPAQSGTGYNIETQNGTVFIATFVYDEAGNPVWYSGTGTINNEGVMVTDLVKMKGGQCIGCDYTAPTATNEKIPVRLRFTSPSEGFIAWSGVSVPIKRFMFNVGEGSARMLGEWIFIDKAPNSIGKYDGDRIIFYRIGEEGKAIGSRASVPYIPADSRTQGFHWKYDYVARVRYATNLITIYVFNFYGANKIEGVSTLVTDDADVDQWVYQIDHSSTPFEGYRVR